MYTTEALDAFVEGWLAAWHEHQGGFPRQPYSPDWPSPCQQGAPGGDGQIEWKPVRRRKPPDFSGFEHALETRAHPDFRQWYGRYYSDNLPARHGELSLECLFVWNDRDFERLIANQLGHVLEKRRARQPLTLFVACVDDPEYLVSMDNTSGAIALERVGHGVEDVLAASAAQFLRALRPCA